MAYEDEVDEDAVLAHMIRHELAHALIRKDIPKGFVNYFDNNGGKENFEKDFSTRHMSARPTSRISEAWAEAVAWFLSKDYPRGGIGANADTRARLPLEVETAILKELRRTN